MAKRRSVKQIRAMMARLKQQEKELIALQKIRNGNGKKRRRKNNKGLVWGGFRANEVNPKRKGQGLAPEF
jgi:hypothetical protein